MSLDEGLSAYIGRLYEAPHEAGTWHRAVGELIERTGSHAAMVTTVDTDRREFSRSNFYGVQSGRFVDGIREYQEEWYATDPSLLWAARNPTAGICDSASLIAKNDYAKHPYIMWNQSRFGSTHWTVAYTPPRDGLSLAVSLHPPADVGPAKPRDRALFRLIFGHMERAVRLAARPIDLSSERDAVILVDQFMRVVVTSPRAAAILATDDGLELRDRTLIVRAPAQAKRLEAALTSAIAAPVDGKGGGSFRISRLSGKLDLILHVTPIPGRLGHLPTGTAAAMVRIVEIDARLRLDAGDAALFDLTGKELSLAEGLLNGHSIDSIAACQSVSRNTVRVHLQSLLRKTATNRQVDLVRLLTAIARH